MIIRIVIIACALTLLSGVSVAEDVSDLDVVTVRGYLKRNYSRVRLFSNRRTISVPDGYRLLADDDVRVSYKLVFPRDTLSDLKQRAEDIVEGPLFYDSVTGAQIYEPSWRPKLWSVKAIQGEMGSSKFLYVLDIQEGSGDAD